MTLKVIAYARNGHTDKFGIPRQSREESPILTRIVFEPEFCVPEALRGIDGYSHLWLIWGFSENQSPITNDQSPITNDQSPITNDQSPMNWSPTVRPPRLGGNKRMGVFASRSPFRPNPIGLSSVKLVEVRANGRMANGEKGMELIVSGADVLDGTPIYDIKPYLSFSDCHEDARNGFAEGTKNRTLEVVLMTGINQDLTGTCIGDAPLSEICYILSQDPRPGYQNDPEREYKMDYAGYTVTFVVQSGTVFVRDICKK